MTSIGAARRWLTAAGLLVLLSATGVAAYWLLAQLARRQHQAAFLTAGRVAAVGIMGLGLVLLVAMALQWRATHPGQDFADAIDAFIRRLFLSDLDHLPPPEPPHLPAALLQVVAICAVLLLLPVLVLGAINRPWGPLAIADALLALIGGLLAIWYVRRFPEEFANRREKIEFSLTVTLAPAGFLSIFELAR